MSTQPAHLSLVDANGQPSPEAPSYGAALQALETLHRQIRLMENELAGKRLAIDNLKADRNQKALDDPLRLEVEVIHACWKKGCGKRRPLDYLDRERISAAVKNLGFPTCLAAVAGACFDSRGKPRRNGKQRYWNDLNDIFRDFGWVEDYAARAPNDWTPNVSRVAAIAGVEEAWVRVKLGIESGHG